MDEYESEARAVAEVVRSYYGAEVVEGVHADLVGELLAVSDGMKLVDLREHIDKRLTAPRRHRGTSTHTTLESFISHVKVHAPASTGRPSVFAADDAKAPKLTAVYNYNGDAPAWGDWRAEYAFPLSEEWQSWQGVFAAKGLTQADFAAHLEDRVTDVLEVGAIGEKSAALAARLGITLTGSAGVLALSRGVQIRGESRVVSATNLSTGDGQLSYEEKHSTDGGNVRVPGGFVLGIPVFRGGDVYQIAVRIRYRLSGGAVAWSFAPHRADAVFRAAFDAAVTRVATETELPVYTGAPER